MIIDGHAHACGIYLSQNSIIDYLNFHNIDRVILCGGEQDSKRNYFYPLMSNLLRKETLSYNYNKLICKMVKLCKLADYIEGQNYVVWKLASTRPDRIWNAYWVDPSDDSCIEKMDKFYQKYGFHMIKLHQCWTDFDIQSKNCRKLFQWAAKNKIPVFIHIISYKQVIRFTSMANKYRNTKFIIAHLIGSQTMYPRLKYNNVFFDLSSPQLYSIGILKKALETYGAERLILGSDAPYGINNIDKIKKRLKKLKVSKRERKLIYGDTLNSLWE